MSQPLEGKVCPLKPLINVCIQDSCQWWLTANSVHIANPQEGGFISDCAIVLIAKKIIEGVIRL